MNTVFHRVLQISIRIRAKRKFAILSIETVARDNTFPQGPTFREIQNAMDVAAAIERQQKTHPALAGLPLAAQIGDLPLFIGEAGAATVRRSDLRSVCRLRN